MTARPAGRSRALSTRAALASLVAAAALACLPSRSEAQAPAPPALGRDSLFACASRLATAAGFRRVTAVPQDRLGMMRMRDIPGASYFLDGLRVAPAPPDSAGAAPPQVRVTTFVVSRATGFNQREIPPPVALNALADSIRQVCRARR